MRRNTSVNSDHRKSSVTASSSLGYFMRRLSFLLPLVLRISRKVHYPTVDVIREMKNPLPIWSSPPQIDRANSRYGVVISMAEDRRGIYNTPERGRNFTLVRLTRVSEVFVITHAPSDRLVNRAVFYVQPQRWHIANRLRKQLSMRNEMEGGKKEGEARNREATIVIMCLSILWRS